MTHAVTETITLLMRLYVETGIQDNNAFLLGEVVI